MVGKEAKWKWPGKKRKETDARGSKTAHVEVYTRVCEEIMGFAVEVHGPARGNRARLGIVFVPSLIFGVVTLCQRRECNISQIGSISNEYAGGQQEC